MQCNICSKAGGPGTLFACGECGYIICGDPACSTKEGDDYICARCSPTGKVPERTFKDKDGKTKTIKEITGGSGGTRKQTAVKPDAPQAVKQTPVDDLTNLAELCADPEKLDAAIKKVAGEIEGKKRFLALLKAAKSGGGK